LGVVFYNIILILSLPLALPVLVIWMIIRPEQRVGLSERFARWAGDWKPRVAGTTRLWIHAASVGECLAVMPLIERWLQERPSWELILSVMTPAGRRLAEQRLGDRVRAFFFPVDLPGISDGLMRRVAPDLILLVETEIWPNFLRAAYRRRVPVLLLNGRVSPRSYPRYRAVVWFMRDSLRTIQGFCMQTVADADRIIELGAPPERVRVLGNFKFDQAVHPMSDTERRKLLNQLGWDTHAPVLVAGSTHEKEEEMLLTVFERVRQEIPDLRLVLAPRHLNRLPALNRMMSQRGVACLRYSELGPTRPAPAAEILLVDTLGALGRLYGLGTVVFVGGSLVPVGGHNLLEPAALGRAVLFGPFIHHVPEMAGILSASGGGRMVRDEGELTRELKTLLIETDRRRKMEDQARETVRRHQGASQRAARIVEVALKRRLSGGTERLDFRSGPERWFKERLLPSRDGIFTTSAAAVLRVISLAYRAWQEIRVAAYRLGLLRSVRLKGPVISVGNLTLGGSGKTPAVLSIGRILLQHGRHPAVLSRGYGGRSSAGVRVASNELSVKPSPDALGDEPCLISEHLPKVPVLVSSDRAAAGRRALEEFHADIFVLDDGFQHLRLKRDLNLLVMDAVEPFGNGHVFPRGVLREAAGQVRRADAILLTHAPDPSGTEALRRFLRRERPGLPIFGSRHRIVDLVRLDTGEISSLATLRETPVVAVTGIGQPDRFFQTLLENESKIALECVYPDHHRYSEKDVEFLEAEARRRDVRRIVTTEKDAVRIRSLGRPLEIWWAARMELVIDDPEGFESMLVGILS
jgi:3-deoxy-D-manno-octulosonic-acid transferase